MSLAEAYDDNVLAEAGTPIQSSLQEGGLFTDLNANLNLRVRQPTDFNSVSSAGTNFRYYSEQHATVGVGHYGSAGLTCTTDRTYVARLTVVWLTRRLIFIKLFATVSPTPPPVGDTAPGYALTDTSSMSYDARDLGDREFSPRNRLTLRGAGHYTDYLRRRCVPAC